MIAESDPPPASSGRLAEASALALRLVQAENALRTLTSGQADAVIDPDGRTYLLHPAQEHLRQEARRLEAVFESAADLITVLNRGGKIVFQSGAASRFLGYEPGTLVGGSLFSLVHPDDLARLYTAFFNVIEELRSDATLEFRHRTRAGEYRVLEAMLSKLRDAAAPGVVLICRDIARRVSAQAHVSAAEEAARQEVAVAAALEAKDHLLAVISHELRTPLMPALLGLDELEDDERFAEARPTLALIRRNLELQVRLLEDLTDFTRVGQQKVRLRLEPIDAHQAVRSVLEICRREIAAAQVEVLLDFQAASSTVHADSMRLQQVMWNLLRNAIKFSAPGSRILITSANQAAGRLTLEFIDHGIGIAAELLPLVFAPFHQGDHAAHQHTGGLGLGLFIAKGLAEAQQATLIVASEGPGKGATFRLTLRTMPPPNASAKPEQPS